MQGVRGSSPRSSTNDRDKASMTKPTAGSRRLGGMIRRLRLLPLCLVLLAACSATPGTTGPSGAPSLAAPTASPSFSPAARPSASLVSDVSGIGTVYTGILSMDAIEGGCAYLQSAGRKLEVIYPDGWQLKKSPLELIAPDGSVHSKGGDRVSIRGSEADDIASICQIGPIIRAIEVLDALGSPAREHGPMARLSRDPRTSHPYRTLRPDRHRAALAAALG